MGGMIKIVVALVLIASLATACAKSTALPEKQSAYYVVGYLAIYNGEETAGQLSFDGLTHLNVAFINPDAEGNINVSAGVKQLVSRAHQHGIKVLLSFGGGSAPAYLGEMTGPSKRRLLVDALMTAVDEASFDGIDVDLEGDLINEHYGAFVAALGQPLKKKGKLLTAALATWTGNKVSDATLDLYDFINIMSYDQTGPWDKSRPGPHSTLTAAVADIAYWQGTRKQSATKLVLGLPFYGYGFGTNREHYTYKDIVSRWPDAEGEDEIAADGGVIYYNGKQTIAKKMELVVDKKLRGAMIWHIAADAPGEHSLLKVVRKAISTGLNE